MGLDGFSMSQLGLHKTLTSAEMAREVESVALRGDRNSVKDVTSIGEKPELKSEDTDYEEGTGHAFGGHAGDDAEEKKGDGNISLDEIADIEKQLEKNPNRYSFNISEDETCVELYDNELKTTVETIAMNDLLSVIHKLDNASGVLINKKI